MPTKHQQAFIEEQGRKFAEMLYDLHLKILDHPSQGDIEGWKMDFPDLDEDTRDNILSQVREGRLYHQERVGWQAIPHDLTVILFVLGTVLFGLKTGLIIGIAALVFLESLFQFIFIRKYYRPLSLLVWLTYPAYVLLGYYLYKQNFAWYWILTIILVTWFGTFLLGTLARIPMQLIMNAKLEASKKKSKIQEE